MFGRSRYGLTKAVVVMVLYALFDLLDLAAAAGLLAAGLDLAAQEGVAELEQPITELQRQIVLLVVRQREETRAADLAGIGFLTQDSQVT
jgi:hypothetical protein